MKKDDVHIGTTYIVKVSNRLAKVRITREHNRGGWYGTNLATGREIRIRTGARLRSEVNVHGEGRLDKIRNLRSEGMSYDDARMIVDKIEF